jgi:hypothetical protein
LWDWFYFLNLTTLKMSVSDPLSEHERNEVVGLSVRYKLYMNPNAIAISLDECGEAAPVDVLRALLQTAEALQDREYARVELHNGYAHKFTLDGEYFQQLGEEYDYQNPVYTARTLPEKAQKPSGTRAYHSLGGGLSGPSDQMENFSQFTLDWCE